jgi:hypothetical protein
MSKPVGGRGIKAPYETAVVRIPADIRDRVEQLSEAYRNGTLDQAPTSPSLEEVIEVAKTIHKQKRSAKKSLELLIKKLYSYDVEL